MCVLTTFHLPCTVGASLTPGGESLCESLVVKVPLKFCSARVLREPVINLTKQSCTLQQTVVIRGKSALSENQPLKKNNLMGQNVITSNSSVHSSNQKQSDVVLPNSTLLQKRVVTSNAPSPNQSQSIVALPRAQFSVNVEADKEEVIIKSLTPPPLPPKKFARVIRLNSLNFLPETSDLGSSMCDDSVCTPVEAREVSPFFKKKRRVTTSAQYKCPRCHRLFCSSASLRRHNMLHTGEKPFKCSVCDRSFIQSHHRQRHELSTHHVICERPKKERVTVRHQSGGSISSSLSGSSPENEERFHKCRVCNTPFENLRKLKHHLTVHDTCRPHCCDLCGMRFLKKIHLAYHMQTHVDKQYECIYCNKRFSRPQTLDQHILLHFRDDTCINAIAGPTTYVCKYCPKLCRSLSGLTRHQAWHLSSKKKHKHTSNCEIFPGDLMTKGKLLSKGEEGEVFAKDDKELSYSDKPTCRFLKVKPLSEDSNSASNSEGGEVFLKERGELLSSTEDDEVFPRERREPLLRGGGDVLSSDLELELDSEDEEGEGLDTVSEGELADESAGTTEESADETLESEQSGLVSEINGVGETSGESDGEMSPLRLDSSEEEEEAEEDSRKSIVGPSNFSSPYVGIPYRNPHNHLKAHKGAVPQYKCEWCGRMFLKRYYLQQHYILHQQVPHQCELCGKVFMSLRYLKRHLRSKHNRF